MLLGIAILLWAFFAPLTFAQTLPCGSISGPEALFEPGGDYDTIVTVAIEDCADPFNVTIDPPSIYSLEINGVEVENGDTYIQDEPIQEMNILGWRPETHTERFLLKHEADGYIYVDESVPEPTEDDYRDFAFTYFDTEAEVEQYLTILFEEQETGDTAQYFFDEEGEYLLDQNTGEPIVDRYNTFWSAANDYVYGQTIAYEPGTYTMVIRESMLLLTHNTIWDTVREFFIKTAHAQYIVEPNYYTITFTIADSVPEPVGASSVLFLPGIMGSKLLEESAECNTYSDNVSFKQIRWPSAGDCDIARLDMSSLGVSEYDIFTEEDGVIEDISAVVNLYESLLEDLVDWKADDLIADYRAVPYDWRLSLYDILKATEVDGRIVPNSAGTYQDGYVYKSLEELVDESPAEKVVLVGHSNGGLVIQALLATMKENNDPLLDAIEKVVLVAVPQIGTPESVVGMLHGVQLAGGVVVSHEESRKLMNTSPFAYHLLPSEGYYDAVATPVITFEPGTSTNPWIAQFGGELDSLEEVAAFLAKESGRVTPEWNDTATPATMYSHLLGYGESVHSYLEDWRPDETQAYEVAGVGIDTPATLTYFTDTDCVRYEQKHFSRNCVEFESKLGYRVHYVIDGDGTVVAPSAVASQGSGVDRSWLDLKAYGRFRLDRIHKDILEVEEVREFVSGVIASSNLGPYTYLSSTAPDFSGENRLLLRLHSPLDMYVVLHDGEVVGSSTPLLRGVEYHRYGEVQQLTIPEDEEDYEIRLVGLAEGSFTLEIEQYEGEEMEERVAYSALPTSTTTKVTINLEDEEMLSEVDLLIDYNGDGIFETTAVPGLSQVTFEAPEAVATSTPVVVEKSGSNSGTKVKDRSTLAAAPLSVLTASTIESEKSEYELLLQLIELLTQYRDLLIKLRLQ